VTPIVEHKSVQSFPVFRVLGEPRKTWLEKFLSIFADVRAGEGLVVVVLTVNLALLLASYYLPKTVREARSSSSKAGRRRKPIPRPHKPSYSYCSSPPTARLRREWRD